ncbi:MAG: nucleoside hydrolase [Actinomycetota bacterium]|nr:nucleoside hydrolase [Actinomycetota bacterium]
MTRRLILDCDTGTDDALAVMLAALHPELELLGVSCVWGNHCVAATTENTLRVLEHIGYTGIPVYAGLDAPSVQRLVPVQAQSLRTAYLPLPPASRSAQEQPAVPWLVDTLRHDAGPVTLVTTGPLTNIAAALRLDRGLVEAVEEVVVMGGTRSVRTSVTPYAERNVWNDPAAADAVLHAGFHRLTLVTLDATYQALMGAADCADLEALGTPAAEAAAMFVTQRVADYRDVPGLDGRAPVHDPLTVAYLLESGMLDIEVASVRVELDDPVTYGRTRLDLFGIANARVALGCDRELFLSVLGETLGGTGR